ncbi:class I ribonucleotide reductase maintenance protein YfaE [Caedibacter taeniospiralis]|uniref:class I ribonucleotide reductase maintenance protein YfaE n=1 Tax=Caedibacter taeniospiralis TaxID=28907 RepID=UPI000C2771B5|nr:class I ribonucleotide reductase maintenance protein YfaE [Caedibacter taeniospiralis]
MLAIYLNDQIIQVEDTDLTILEALENEGIAANFQCRNGVCGTCRCQLISGKVKYVKEPLASIQSDEVLICIAVEA